MEKKNMSGLDYLRLFGAATMMGIILWVSWWAICYALFPGKTPEAAALRGQFGDMFGGINALFSSLTIAGLLCTIVLQIRQLGLQQGELEETRKELERSAEQQEDTRAIMREQMQATKKFSRMQALSALIADTNAEIERNHQTGRVPQELIKERNLLRARLQVELDGGMKVVD